MKTAFTPVRASLADLAGREYAEAVCAARAVLTGESRHELLAEAKRRVDFFPRALHEQLVALIPRIGARCTRGLRASASGATSAAFAANAHREQAPLSARGYYRVGEDGRLFFTAKSEHYHASLGHGFPGYALIECARRLGIPNATHNNTRGHLTRLLEEQLVRAAALPRVLDRVLNLETGSLAAEAVFKMMLARFQAPQADSAQPPYADRVPVFGVIGDDLGGMTANYHGTTIATQLLRGMWPGLRKQFERHDVLLVRAVAPNDARGLDALFERYERGRYKLAGFFHELVLMNYGGVALSERFVRRLYRLCRTYDVPVAIDEIQTGAWSPLYFLYREYKLRPDFAVIGKGFPGGEYAASRVLFSAKYDSLPQFGALVTNGQEELASLAYLVTMRWIEANTDVIQTVGDYYRERLEQLAVKHADRIVSIDGRRHMAGIRFHDLDVARRFAAQLNAMGVDVGVQSYKTGCPPSALTKLPLIAGYEIIDWLIDRMDSVLSRIRA
ncbi:MAG: aminotransferase class III-fold pyridoxal phosphate-dependent enzyme [Candidatus Hydrogenedentes bacterium]|nr:aminotransferase class III-fold pyridoxal phosphate-dependent enzyme [Candidatus Hydrogenedentota bacterium]